MASSTLGRWPLLGGGRFARAAIPRPGVGHDGAVVARAIGDYLFGLDEQPAAAELAVSRIPDGSFRWVIQWRTDVRPGRDGSEQRSPTMSSPRHRFEGEFLLDDADTRTVRQLLSANAAGVYELPLAHEAVAAVVDITGGTIYVDPTHCDWIAPGRRLYVRGPAGDAYTTTITGASGGTVNVSSSPPVGGRFPAGLTLVFPIEEIRLENNQAIARYPVHAARWRFSGRAAARAQLGTGAPAAVMFDGYRVLDRRPYQEKTVEEVADGAVEFLDNGATMSSATSWARAKLRRLGTWRIDSPSDRQWAKDFFSHCRGRYQPFLFPTWRPDLELHEQPAAGGAVIRVTTDYINNWYPSLAHRRLQIEYADSSVTHHYVHSKTQGSGYQELTLVPTLANPIPTGGVTRVSFLETARLDTDEVAIEYVGGWKGKTSAPSIVVQESKARSFAWPSTASAARAAFGYGTWSGAWDLNEQHAPVVDSIGGVALNQSNAPTYQVPGPFAGDMAVRFASNTTDQLVATSSSHYNLGTAQSLAVYVCLRFTTLLNRYFVSKYGGVFGWGLQFQSSPGGRIYGQVSPTLLALSDADHWQGGAGNWHDVLMIIDRPVHALQVFTELASSSPTDISSASDLNNGVAFRIGGNASVVGCDIAFVAMATGDVSDLRANATTAIANIRRYTGRA